MSALPPRLGGAVRSRQVAGALALAGLAWSSAAAQSRATLETKVTASGDQIVLEWGKKHPWDAELRASGAFLLVEYQTAGGKVGIDCLNAAAAQRGARSAMAGPGCAGIAGTPDPKEERARRFHLPDGLTAAPTGRVCLYIQLPNRRVLPLRQAGRGQETTRFLYQPWSDRMIARAQFNTHQARRQATARAIAVKRREVEQQEAVTARNGWASATACEGIAAPELQKSKATRPLAEPAERDEIARRVCTMRVANADRILDEVAREKKWTDDLRVIKVGTGLVHGPSTLDFLFSLLPRNDTDPDQAARRQQAEEFRRDFSRWSPRVREYQEAIGRAGFKQPHFGTFDDLLYLQSITDTVGKLVREAIQDKATIPPYLLLGYIGGTLEAYTRCVADGSAQLATAHTAAKELATRSPQLEEAARRQLVGACNAGFEKLSRLKAELTDLERQLAELEAQTSAGGDGVALPDQTVELNAAACTP